MFVDSTHGTVHLTSFVSEYIHWKDIPVGIAVVGLSFGIATAAVGVIAIAAIVRAVYAAPARSAEGTAVRHSFLGPLTLIVPALIFWIANPRPGRHFILCLAGVSLLAGWLVPRLAATRPLLVYALALGIVFANQACGALAGPLILRHAPSKIVVLPGDIHHLLRGIPTGSSWSYHRALAAEELGTNAFANRVRATCSDKTLVLSLDATQIFSDLYAGSGSWSADEQRLNRFPILTAHLGDRTIAVLSESEGWPQDAAAYVLADPTFRDYKLARDPNTISIYDHAVIPPERIAQLNCAP
jgi:hypothetical protein